MSPETSLPQTPVQQALNTLAAPVFLATEHRGQILLHTSLRSGLRALERSATAALRAQGIDQPCRVIRHSQGSLLRARSLEALCEKFGQGRLVYDPTQYFARAESLVKLSRMIRQNLGDDVRSVCIDNQRRVLHIVVEAPNDTGAAALNGRNIALVKAALGIVQAWQPTAPKGLQIAVRISESAPAGAELVIVDRRSFWKAVRGAFAQPRLTLRRAGALVLALTMGGSLALPAISGTAVKKTNFGLIAKGGAVDGNEKFDVGGKGTFPIGENFGGQIEIGGGNDNYHGVGAQFFWRDPNQGLIGVFASHENELDLDLDRFGIMGELYLDQITIGAKIGVQSGDVDEDIIGAIDVTYYASDDLKLRLGGDFTPEVNTAIVGIEWKPAVSVASNLSVFADVSVDDQDQTAVMVGLKLHFGESLSLIDRDRTEDPDYVIFRRNQLEILTKEAEQTAPPRVGYSRS